MKLKRYTCLILGFLNLTIFAQTPGNTIKVDPDDDLNEIVRKSTLVIPSDRQYQWQQLEYIAFIHFGQNTFHAVEWGNGKEDPKDFYPTELDANQWISVVKDAGMKMAMLTVKHHDGFCLWPTRTTDHSVKSSNWKNGNGDVLSELVTAARKQDIKVGLYLSPADLHEIERPGGTYGNGSKPHKVQIPSNPELQRTAKKIFEYELDDYDALFMNQLYEILTEYGQIEEVWFDGANPKPGTGQTYNRKAWYDMIRQLQPGAVIAIKGPDVRWCGNEAGHTRKAEWSVLPVPTAPEDYDWPDKTKDDLGSREMLKDANYLYWYPAETNTSVRQGWFYRDDKQYVKTVEHLLDLWYRSVGGNTVLLLNLTPDRRGLIPEKDAARLRETGRIIRQSFQHNLAAEATISASAATTDHSAALASDGNEKTFWKPEDGTTSASLTISLGAEKTFNAILLQEAIRTQGQRVEAFAIDVWKNSSWQEVDNSTTIGYKSIRRIPMVTTDKVRVRITESRVAPTLSEIGIYKTIELLGNPQVIRNREGVVRFEYDVDDTQIHFTTNGTEPARNSPVYQAPFSLPRGGKVKAIAYALDDSGQSEVVSADFDLCPAKWEIVAVSSELEGYKAVSAIDADPLSVWKSAESENIPFIEIALGEKVNLKGFTYLPDAMDERGICREYKLDVSRDGKKWETVATGAFGNIKNNPVLQEERFDRMYPARFIRLSCLESLGGGKHFSAAEIGVLTQ